MNTDNIHPAPKMRNKKVELFSRRGVLPLRKPEFGEVLSTLLSRHGLEGSRRPAKVLGEVRVDKRLEPLLAFLMEVDGNLPHRLLICMKTDDVAMIVQPVLDVFVLTILSHELRSGVSRLWNPLALGELAIEQDIHRLIHDEPLSLTAPAP